MLNPIFLLLRGEAADFYYYFRREIADFYYYFRRETADFYYYFHREAAGFLLLFFSGQSKSPYRPMPGSSAVIAEQSAVIGGGNTKIRKYMTRAVQNIQNFENRPNSDGER